MRNFMITMQPAMADYFNTDPEYYKKYKFQGAKAKGRLHWGSDYTFYLYHLYRYSSPSTSVSYDPREYPLIEEIRLRIGKIEYDGSTRKFDSYGTSDPRCPFTLNEQNFKSKFYGLEYPLVFQLTSVDRKNAGLQKHTMRFDFVSKLTPATSMYKALDSTLRPKGYFELDFYIDDDYVYDSNGFLCPGEFLATKPYVDVPSRIAKPNPVYPRITGDKKTKLSRCFWGEEYTLKVDAIESEDFVCEPMTGFTLQDYYSSAQPYNKLTILSSSKDEDSKIQTIVFKPMETGSNVGYFVMKYKNDASTSPESNQIIYRRGEVFFTVADRNYSIKSSASTVKSGDTLTFTFESKKSGETYFWTVCDNPDSRFALGEWYKDYDIGIAPRSCLQLSRAQGEGFTKNSDTLSIKLVPNDKDSGPKLLYCYVFKRVGYTTMLVAVSDVIIAELPPPVTYKVTPLASIINEGDTLIFNITTTGVADGSIIYWRLENIGLSRVINLSDFELNALFGEVAINNGAAQVTVKANADRITEGDEKFILSLYRSPKFEVQSFIPTTNVPIIIRDTSVYPTISIEFTTTTVDEGKDFFFYLRSKNIEPGDNVWWEVVPQYKGVVTEDFVAANGTVNLTSELTKCTLSVIADLKREGLEKFSIKVYRDATKAKLLATSTLISVVDTSAPKITASVVVDRSEINEGDKLTFIISTQNMVEGEALYWKVTGENITEIDFVGFQINGAAYNKQNKAVVQLVVNSDYKTEGREKFTFIVYYDVENKIELARSPEVAIVDTSLSFSITAKDVVSEGETIGVCFIMKNTDYTQSNTGLAYWKINPLSAGISNKDFSSITGKIFLQAANLKYDIPVTVLEDCVAEGDEFFNVIIYENAEMTKVILESPAIRILDKFTDSIWAKLEIENQNYPTSPRDVIAAHYKVKLTTNANKYYWLKYSNTDPNVSPQIGEILAREVLIYAPTGSYVFDLYVPYNVDFYMEVYADKYFSNLVYGNRSALTIKTKPSYA